MNTLFAPSTVPDGIPTLQLLPGERVVHEGVPSGTLRLSVLLVNSLAATVCVVPIPFLPVILWAALRSVAVHRYWLTDQRLVVRTGIIGYQMRSIPLSRIVDVSVQSSWFDRLLGLTHINVRDMTGESAGQGASVGVRLLGVQNPDRWTTSILTRSASAPVPGGSAVESDRTELDTVVTLLRTLVERAA